MKSRNRNTEITITCETNSLDECGLWRRARTEHFDIARGRDDDGLGTFAMHLWWALENAQPWLLRDVAAFFVKKIDEMMNDDERESLSETEIKFMEAGEAVCQEIIDCIKKRRKRQK